MTSHKLLLYRLPDRGLFYFRYFTLIDFLKFFSISFSLIFGCIVFAINKLTSHNFELTLTLETPQFFEILFAEKSTCVNVFTFRLLYIL